MLKFLTHKLRTHSLNEESVSEKVGVGAAERCEGHSASKWPPQNKGARPGPTPSAGRSSLQARLLLQVEERDSGTESDDEAERGDAGDFCADVIMKWNDVTDISMGGEACACAPAPPRLLPEPEPDHLYDHHSSEEELEVINGAPRGAELGGAGAGAAGAAGAAESRRRGASSPPPACAEKRKWPAPPYHDAEHDDLAPRPASSDDDDTKVETPVRFRTSPPLEALKPRRAGVCGCAGAARAARGALAERSARGAAPERAPPSPRRRRAPLPPPRRHRPALDFDKMQQLRVGGGGVRSWRAVGGAHGGELSVFCW